VSGAPFPIRPVALLVENFRGLGGEHSLDLDRDLTVLVGKNGAGKSSLLVAIEWCLFGAEATTSSDSGIAERSLSAEARLPSSALSLSGLHASTHACVSAPFAPKLYRGRPSCSPPRPRREHCR
jgi:DNA repair ATPase RecN